MASAMARRGMLKDMAEAEPFKRQADSGTDPELDEESTLGPVAEQRVPRSLSQLPSKTLWSGAFARLLATRSADGAEVHAAIEEVRGEVDERIGRGLGPVVAMIEARFDRQGAKIDRLVEEAVAHNAQLEALTEAVAATNASLAATNARIDALDAKITALKWMFGILIALLAILAAAGVFNSVFSRPGVATSDSSSRTAPSAVAADPPQPPPNAAVSSASAKPAEVPTPIQDEFAPESRTAR